MLRYQYTIKRSFYKTDKKSGCFKSHQYHHDLGHYDRKNHKKIPD